MVPEGWSITKLSDLADVKRGAGSQYLTYVDEPGEGIRLIRIGDFLGDNPKYVSHTSDMDRFILKKDDILIAGTGATAGITFEVPEHFEGFAFSYNAPRIRPKGHVDKVFLVNFLKSNEITKQQRSLFTGNAQPFLDTKAIGGFKISTPPLPEQRKIADILSTWDKAIETTEALLATARTQKRALMQSLLTGKRRFPEFEGQVWKEVRLGDVTTLIVSNVDKKTKAAEMPVRLCNYTDVYKRDTINPTQDFMEATATKAQIKKFGMMVGDVIITKDSETADDIAMPTYVAETADDLVCGYHLAIVRPGKTVEGRFLKFYFDLPHTRYYFGTRANGAIRFGLTIDGIEGAKINLPSLEEQRRIATVIAEAEVEIEQVRNEIEKLRTEKKALMQQLLTGKRRVVV